MEPELKEGVASRPGAGWVERCGRQGRSHFTRLNEGGTSGLWPNVLQILQREHALCELHLPLRRGRSSPGGWRCSRPQGASGLCRLAANSKKNQNQNTEVSQDCSSNNDHGIRPLEQSKAFLDRRFEITAEEKVNVFSAAKVDKRRIKAWEDQQIYNETLSIMKLPVRVSSNSKSSYQ